jgi:uncharacterized protein YdhG (YjbR/CyaY superfamily)
MVILAGYNTTSDSLQFLLDKLIPENLIKEIVLARIKEYE